MSDSRLSSNWTKPIKPNELIIYMEYLTVDEIIQIHEKVIEKFGGESGIANQGNLQFIVDKVQ